jgi:hypothetical protein
LNHTVTLTLPSVSAAAAIPAATVSVSELQKLLGIASGEPEFLPQTRLFACHRRADATTLVGALPGGARLLPVPGKLDFTAGAGAS